MGVSLYLVFYNKLLRPTKKYKLALLGVTFIVYLLLGAYVFREINLPVELRERKEISEYKDHFQKQHKCIHNNDLNEFISLILNASDSGILLLDKLNDDIISENWVFGGETVFFSFTLLATIGYGHLAPLTQNGKIFCMFYALIGVPITMLLLTVIVDRLECALTRNLTQDECTAALIDAKRYRYRNYWTISKRPAEMNTNSSVDGNIYLRTFTVFLVLVIIIYSLPSYVFTNFTELNWTILDSIYYTYISITTIGFGDLVPGEEQIKDFRNVYRMIITVYLFVGIVCNMLFLNLMIRLPLFSKIYVFLLNIRLRHQNRRSHQLLANESCEENNRSNSLNSSSSSSSSSKSPSVSSRLSSSPIHSSEANQQQNEYTSYQNQNTNLLKTKIV